MTTVRPLAVATPVSPQRPHDLTRVRPPEVASVRGVSMSQPPSAPVSSARVSIPSAGEINRQVRNRKNGMLALYWAAGIVAMLTAGGILTAMIARGDADSLIQRQAAQPPAVTALPAPTQQQPAAAAPAAPVAEAPKPAATVDAKKAPTTAAIPGTKPGQIVDLQLWKKNGAAPTNAAPAAPTHQSASTQTQAAAPRAPATTTTTTTRSNVSTPDNDPAVRLARDQLESSFK